jgi:hypothetical protein
MTQYFLYLRGVSPTEFCDPGIHSSSSRPEPSSLRTHVSSLHTPFDDERDQGSVETNLHEFAH